MEIQKELMEWVKEHGGLAREERIEMKIDISFVTEKLPEPVEVITRVTALVPGTFHQRRGQEFYSRQLHIGELDELNRLTVKGWKKALVNYVLNCGNNEVDCESIERILLGWKIRGRRITPACGITYLNTDLTRRKASHRLIWSPGQNIHNGPYRFYRKVD